MSKKLPKQIEEALENTKLDWALEVGKRHYKIRLQGRLVGIVSMGVDTERSQRAALNTVGQIRRMARELKNDA